MTKVSELTDSQLCEAISELREPEISSKEEFYYGDFSPLKNWQFVECPKWNPINWLAPDNWTRLLEEVAKHIDNIEVDSRAFEYNPPHRSWGIHCVNFYVERDTLSRAVCEAWLIVNGGGKYE